MDKLNRSQNALRRAALQADGDGRERWIQTLKMACDVKAPLRGTRRSSHVGQGTGENIFNAKTF